MKQIKTWFKKQGKLLQVVFTILVVAVLAAVCLLVYNIVKNIANGAKGVTDALGLTKSAAQADADKDVTTQAWNTSLYTSHPNEATLSSSQMLTMAAAIYDSWGFFSKDFDTTLATFKKCHNKVDVSGLCQCFVDKYNKDLLAYISPLKFTMSFRNYPTDAQFDMIHNFVNGLPND